MAKRYIDIDPVERSVLEGMLRRELERSHHSKVLSLLAKVVASTTIRFDANRGTLDRRLDLLRIEYEDQRK